MRWKKTFKTIPKEGDVRTRRKFLLLPHTFDGETKWLEMATVKEVVMRLTYMTPECPYRSTYLKWVEVGFADEQ